MAEDEYNGWTNYETWAVKLHWDNNQGDYNYFTNTAREFKEGGKTVAEFSDWIHERAEEIFDVVLGNEEGVTPNQEQMMFVTDVGSLWRVNWFEIAEAYFSEVE